MDQPFQIIRQKRKTLALTIDENGRLIVKAPVRIPNYVIMEFIKEKEKWIEKQRQQICKHPAVKKQYKNGECFLYLGEEYHLKILEENTKEGKIHLSASQMILSAGKMSTQSIKRAVEQWYKEQAERIILERVFVYHPLIGGKYGKITLKDTKSQWGSCSSKGNLSFNYRIVMAPLPIIDYLVVHELCHLVYLNHSPSFWNLVGQWIPDYKERRKWLKTHGVLFTL